MCPTGSPTQPCFVYEIIRKVRAPFKGRYCRFHSPMIHRIILMVLTQTSHYGFKTSRFLASQRPSLRVTMTHEQETPQKEKETKCVP